MWFLCFANIGDGGPASKQNRFNVSFALLCFVAVQYPVNGKHLYNICTLLDQRRRRWADVVQMLYKCFCVCSVSHSVRNLHILHLLYLINRVIICMKQSFPVARDHNIRHHLDKLDLLPCRMTESCIQTLNYVA